MTKTDERMSADAELEASLRELVELEAREDAAEQAAYDRLCDELAREEGIVR